MNSYPEIFTLAYNLVLIGARSPCFPQFPSFSSSRIIKLDYMQGAFKSLLKRPITVQVSEVGWCKNPASLLTSDLICDLTISPVIVVVSIWRTCGVMALSRKECEVVQILSTLFCFVLNLFLRPWVFYTIFLELNRKTLGTREHTPGDSLSRDEYCHRFL